MVPDWCSIPSRATFVFQLHLSRHLLFLAILLYKLYVRENTVILKHLLTSLCYLTKSETPHWPLKQKTLRLLHSATVFKDKWFWFDFLALLSSGFKMQRSWVFCFFVLFAAFVFVQMGWGTIWTLQASLVSFSLLWIEILFQVGVKITLASVHSVFQNPGTFHAS